MKSTVKRGIGRKYRNKKSEREREWKVGKSGRKGYIRIAARENRNRKRGVK